MAIESPQNEKISITRASLLQSSEEVTPSKLTTTKTNSKYCQIHIAIPPNPEKRKLLFLRIVSQRV